MKHGVLVAAVVCAVALPALATVPLYPDGRENRENARVYYAISAADYLESLAKLIPAPAAGETASATNNADRMLQLLARSQLQMMAASARAVLTSEKLNEEFWHWYKLASTCSLVTTMKSVDHAFASLIRDGKVSEDALWTLRTGGKPPFAKGILETDEGLGIRYIAYQVDHYIMPDFFAIVRDTPGALKEEPSSARRIRLLAGPKPTP